MLWDDEEDCDSELWKQNGQVWGPWHWRVSFYDEFSKKMEDFYAKMSLQRHFPCGDCARKTCGTPNGAVDRNDTIWPFSSRLIVSKRSVILPGDNRQTVSELSCRTPVNPFSWILNAISSDKSWLISIQWFPNYNRMMTMLMAGIQPFTIYRKWATYSTAVRTPFFVAFFLQSTRPVKSPLQQPTLLLRLQVSHHNCICNERK